MKPLRWEKMTATRWLAYSGQLLVAEVFETASKGHFSFRLILQPTQWGYVSSMSHGRTSVTTRWKKWLKKADLI